MEFGATGTHLVVAYDIVEEAAPAFNVSVYRSADGVLRDALVGSREVTLEQDRTVGRHVIGVGADFVDPRDDYQLIAMVDPANNLAETSEDNNEIAFRGGAFLMPDGTLHVHGGDSAETVRIEPSDTASADGSASGITVKINEWTMDYATTTVNDIHVRLHGGDDMLKVEPQLQHNIQVHGGAGNDRILTGAGSDWLVGGAGDDFIAGRGNRDLIDGSEGDDTLVGGAGQDTLVGWHGNDKLVGGPGRDLASGGDGVDVLDGGADDDRVWGGRRTAAFSTSNRDGA
jgi:Ca2+-binding RTX toxin-like protein